MQLNPYLNFGGNCAEAFRFYEANLGGKILFTMTWDEMPEPKQVPPGLENKVLHANIELGKTQIMGADVPNYEPMRSAYLTLRLESDEEAEHVYKLLSEDGQIFMAMQETFFATRFAMLRDKFGVNWMLLHDRPRT